MTLNFREHTYSVFYNLCLITCGSLIYSLAIKGIALNHNFIPAGLFGISVLIQQLTGLLDAGSWYIIFNIPMFALAWTMIGRRFLLYSLFAMLVTGLSYSVLPFNFVINNQLYAAVTCGALSGAGAGIVLRSLGSNGGIDVLAVILFQRFNIGIGRFYLIFNLILFSICFFTLDADLVIVSLIMAFVSAKIVDQVLAMFSERKMTLVISRQSQQIADEVLEKLKIGSTFLDGTGAFNKKQQRVLMTVINNIQLKRLEEIVFMHDPDALFIVENTFNVIGSSFSKRKIY